MEISDCELETSQLKTLSAGLSSNRSLNVLDLSNNLLDDQCGTTLGKIVSAHGFAKDEVVWLHSLRNEIPSEDLNKKGTIC